MKQNIWIWNHYATNMYFDKAGRHYWFAENLIESGYKPTVFCASTNHFSDKSVDTKGEMYVKQSKKEIPFVFVNTPEYKGNGKKRTFNMIAFYRNLFPVAKHYAKINGRPNVIIASSVHPLTLVAGIKIAKKYGIPCVCEIRDLWPESLVAYDMINKRNPIFKLLYAGEKWIYKKADKLIFTMEGGNDYIIEKGWDKEQGGPIDLLKVYHINNGLNLEEFEKNIKDYQFIDQDLDNSNTFKVVYTGSIRLINKVNKLVEAAKVLKDCGNQRITFLIWGDGDEREALQQKVKELALDNIVFKGRVEKKYIPYILSKSNLNVYILPDNRLYRFGLSLNKSFEYFASGKPVLASSNSGYSLIDKYNCGKALNKYDINAFVNEIIAFSEMSQDKYNDLCENAIKSAQDYDFRKLTNDLIEIIESR